MYHDLSQAYLKFIVRSTYDSDLQRAKNCPSNIVKLICEHHLRQSYDFASGSYLREALHSS